MSQSGGDGMYGAKSVNFRCFPLDSSISDTVPLLKEALTGPDMLSTSKFTEQAVAILVEKSDLVDLVNLLN